MDKEGGEVNEEGRWLRREGMDEEGGWMRRGDG